MKKKYSKPQITVEPLKLDQPIAAGCTADFDDIRDLVEMDYFTSEMNCNIQIPASGPIFPEEGGHDTICYHSNVQIAFTS